MEMLIGYLLNPDNRLTAMLEGDASLILLRTSALIDSTGPESY